MESFTSEERNMVTTLKVANDRIAEADLELVLNTLPNLSHLEVLVTPKCSQRPRLQTTSREPLSVEIPIRISK